MFFTFLFSEVFEVLVQSRVSWDFIMKHFIQKGKNILSWGLCLKLAWLTFLDDGRGIINFVLASYMKDTFAQYSRQELFFFLDCTCLILFLYSTFNLSCLLLFDDICFWLCRSYPFLCTIYWTILGGALCLNDYSRREPLTQLTLGACMIALEANHLHSKHFIYGANNDDYANLISNSCIIFSQYWAASLIFISSFLKNRM